MTEVNFNLGDTRLNQRGQYCLTKLLREPMQSFPDIFNHSKELQGFYRFINNSSFESGDLKKAIFNHTRSCVTSCTEAIAIHDTTEVRPPKASNIQGFKYSKGFFAHLSLIVDAGDSRQIYGAGGLRLYSRSGRVVTKGSTGEQYRWINQVREVALAFNQTSLIHVMDREGDMQGVWSEMKTAQQRFVIRANVNRYVKSKMSEEKAAFRLFEEVTKITPIAQRKVTLSKRTDLYPGKKTANMSRDKRETILNISAHSFDVYKTLHEKKAKKDTVELNIVRVFEEPTEGEKNLVEWLLITNEPIETAEQILKVVDIYRSRWLVEEFFKCLKTGCRLEERLFTDVESWYKMITLLLPVATSLLNLRLREDENVGQNSVNSLSSVQLKILEIKAREFKKEFKTYKNVQYVLAQLGGHIAANGPPGWITLLKGYRKLLSMEQGWLLAHSDM